MNFDDEGLGLPKKHGCQVRLGMMQIETNVKVGSMTNCCFVVAISYLEKASLYTKLTLNEKIENLVTQKDIVDLYHLLGISLSAIKLLDMSSPLSDFERTRARTGCFFWLTQ